MSSNDSFNLFSQSSQPSKSPLRREKKEPPAAPKPHQQEETVDEVQRSERRAKLFKDPQIKEWLERIETMHKEIDNKTNILLEKSGFSPASVKRYLENPANFNPVELEIIQEGREQLEKTIGKAMGENMRQFQKKTQVNQMAKGRKGKTLGSRKKWMDMR